MFSNDTPGGSPRKYDYVPVRLDMSDEEEYCDEGFSYYSDDSGVGEKRPDQTVFDLSLNYSDEDELYDWGQHAALRRLDCCGLDLSWIRNCVPCCNLPPAWWVTLPNRKRRLLLLSAGTICIATLLTTLGILLAMLPGDTDIDSFHRSYPLCNWDAYSLPEPYHLKPSLYMLTLKAQMEEPFNVTGHEMITLDVYEDTPCFVLHALDMNITSVVLEGTNATAQLQYNADLGQYTFKFDRLLPKPSANVSIHFDYTLNAGLSGFYRSSYTVGDGVTYIMATTQFESTAARQALPCFDEPRFKARFGVSLVVPDNLVALSNMPEVEQTKEQPQGSSSSSSSSSSSIPVPDGFTRHVYDVTPPMSVYLLAFVVGNLSGVSTTVECPFPDVAQCPAASRKITVWGTPDRSSSLQFAVEVAAASVVGFEKTLGVPYALPKMDLAAIPDFAAGAMENWGLITFRETDLLITQNKSSIASYRDVGLTIAHEIAHQWFGDLLTMGQWGELWLNEGFASYFEYVGATIAEPGLQYFDTFYIDTATSGLSFDSQNSSHPLSITEGVIGDDKIDALFDSVMYNKGGSVLRQLRAFLNAVVSQDEALRRRLLQHNTQPQDPFMRVLGSYLHNNRFGLVTAERLWGTFAKTLHLPVDEWMSSWTYRQGYPLVTLELMGADGKDVKIRQDGFMHGGFTPCNSSSAWWIPLSYTTAAKKDILWETYSQCKPDSVLHRLGSKSDWVKLNAGQYGFYRVAYPHNMLQRLQRAFITSSSSSGEGGVISSVDYAGLLDDAYALALAGVTHINDFLDLTKTLMYRTVPDYQPWAVAVPHLKKIQLLVPCADQWQAYVRDKLVASWLTTALGDSPPSSLMLGSWTNQPVLLRLMRPLLILTAGWFESPDVVKECNDLVGNLTSGGIFVDPDIAEEVYDVAVRSGQQSSYHIMKQFYRKATVADEKLRFLSALTFTPNPVLINDSLYYALGGEVRSQDAPRHISGVARQGGTSLNMTWEFVKQHYREIWTKFGADIEASRALGALLTRVASLWSSKEKIDEMYNLYNSNKDILDEDTYVRQAEENIVANERWVAQHGAAVCKWLEDNAR